MAKKGCKAWNKKTIDLELMKKLYYENKWDYKRIANHFGFKSKSAIYDRFKKLGLKARDNTDLKTGFKHSEETKEKIRKGHIKYENGKVDGKGYLRISKVIDKYGLAHRSVWIENNGPIPKGYVVHHINENKLDNCIQNLQLMTISEHITHHKN